MLCVAGSERHWRHGLCLQGAHSLVRELVRQAVEIKCAESWEKKEQAVSKTGPVHGYQWVPLLGEIRESLTKERRPSWGLRLVKWRNPPHHREDRGQSWWNSSSRNCTWFGLTRAKDSGRVAREETTGGGGTRWWNFCSPGGAWVSVCSEMELIGWPNLWSVSLRHCLIWTCGMDFQVPGLKAVTLVFMLNSSLELMCSPEMLQDPEERELALPKQQLGNTCLLLGAAPGSQGFWCICTLEAANHPAAPKTSFSASQEF